MRKSRHLLAFEAKHGRPAVDVIADAINEHGSISAAARALDVSHNTLLGWSWRLRITVSTVAQKAAS